MYGRSIPFVFLLLIPFVPSIDSGLVGHWRLAVDAKDVSGRGNHGEGRDVRFAGNEGAEFDGKRSRVTIPNGEGIRIGKSDFSVSVRIKIEDTIEDVVGDLVTKFDPTRRVGFNLTVKSGPGETTSQSNLGHLQFGIDAGTDPVWVDEGRPGKAVYVMALAVHEGRLHAGTCEPGSNQAGHVYRYESTGKWVDLGSPDACNAVTSLASFGGKLHVGTGRYRLAGSSLEESTNPKVGGLIARLESDGTWSEVGRLPNVEAIGGMVEYRGSLYASSLYKPPGLFKLNAGKGWKECPLPPDGRRVVALGVFNGWLYATSYDACAVYRFDGERWESLGELESSGQTYSFEAYRGKLHVGTWPNGRVFRFDEPNRWVSVGRLGDEKEVMGMAVYNGKLYAGTLPLAEVYRYEEASNWTRVGRVDLTPDVRYRRAWSTALHQGRLFFGTLPSGRVHSLRAGTVVSYDHRLMPGTRHIVAVRRGSELSLYVDGARVASAVAPGGEVLDLSNESPLEIGTGMIDSFRGKMSDVRLYDRALTEPEIAKLAKYES